ncbi:MAG: SurA N-terminal domain-containing protein [Candidatus Omnitrophota bacterium]
MLRTMRNNAKKYHWTLWLVIGAFVIGFVASDAFRSKDGKADAMSELVYIDGKVAIRGDEFYKALSRILESYRSQFKSNFNKSLITQLGIPEQILRSMLYTEILKKEAEKMNMTVSDEEVKNKILTNPQFQRNGQFIGVENYERLLAYSKMDVTDFENQLRDQILNEKLQELVAGAIEIDPKTLRNEFKKDKDNVEMELITLRPDRVPQDITPDENELTAYYAQHKEEFKSDERRAGYAIPFKFDDYKKEVKVSEKELFDYFNLNKSDFIIPGRTKVSRIFLKYDPATREEVYKKAEVLQKELTPENFAEKSMAASEDPKAKTGGDYGYTEWKQFTPQELSLIDSMQQSKISPAIDTQSGFSILLVTEKVKDINPVFNDVKLKIKDSIEQEKLIQIVKDKLQKIYKKLEKSDNMKAKAQDMGIKAIETGSLTNDQGIKNIDEMGYISRQLFSSKQGEITFPVQFDKGIAIVQLTKIEKPVVEPFNKVKDRVRAKVVTVKKVEILKNEAATIAAELNKTDSQKVEEFLKGKNLKTENYTYKRGNRINSQTKKGLDDMIFSLDLNRYANPIALDSEVIIVKAKSKKITDNSDFEKEKATYYAQKLREARTIYFNIYMEQRMNSYQITSNPQLLREIEDEVMRRY